MKYLFEMMKIVEAGIAGDKNRLVAYAQQLADKAEQDGEEKSASRIRRAVSGSKSNSLQTAQLLESPRLPVDSDSRLSLADEERPSLEDVMVFLEPEAQERVDEFLRYIRGADRLIQNDVPFSPTFLLYGAPGCGKTQLARFVAASLGLPILTARLDSMVSSFLGSTAKNVRYLFDHAKSRPCILFLDEFDALAKLRDDQNEQGELKRVVVSLLQNIDLLDSGTILLAATNHPHLLDPAVWRRFTYKVEMTPPSPEQRRRMFEHFLGKYSDEKQVHVCALASQNSNGAMIRECCEGALRDAVLDAKDMVETANVLKRLLACHNISTLPNGDTDENIRRARAISERAFSYRRLSEIFGRSTGHISTLLGQDKEA